jgi:hypothetical protein
VIVDAISSGGKNAPEIVVISDMNDPAVPEAVGKTNSQQMSHGAVGQAEGFFLYKGKVRGELSPQLTPYLAQMLATNCVPMSSIIKTSIKPHSYPFIAAELSGGFPSMQARSSISFGSDQTQTRISAGLLRLTIGFFSYGRFIPRM